MESQKGPSQMGPGPGMGGLGAKKTIFGRKETPLRGTPIRNGGLGGQNVSGMPPGAQNPSQKGGKIDYFLERKTIIKALVFHRFSDLDKIQKDSPSDATTL